MKKSYKKYEDIIWLSLITFLIALITYCLKFDPEIFISIIAICISISFGVRQYRIENDKIFLELFQSFNNKYDKKFNDKLNNEKIELSKEFVIDYLNLCSEEYLWYTKGRIPEDVWSAWKKGMIHHFNRPRIKKIVLREMKKNESYYRIFDEIKIQ